MFHFDDQIDRRNTASEKWDRYGDKDIIPLWVADMDFRSPPPVIKALHQRIEHGVFGYSGPPAELVETVVALFFREYRWQVQPEWLVWLPGLVCGLNVACRAVGQTGDAVATFTPVYPPFLTAPALAGRELVTAGLVEQQGRWVMDLDALEQAITDRTRLLMLCSPHNPVGRIWTYAEQLALAELVERHNLIVCSDEIHAGLLLDAEKQHVPFATLSPELARRTITLHAPSKTWNIPGLGCSFAIIPDNQLRQAFCGVMAGIVPHVNLLGYTAALAAYRDGEPWRQALVAYLRENRDLVQRSLGEMTGLKTWAVEATYLAWIDARSLKVAHPAHFFEQAGVGLSDGEPFGAPGFLRLNFGCPRKLLQQALERMKAVC
jgi:cysteine-S-conjugate beta-lyase